MFLQVIGFIFMCGVSLLMSSITFAMLFGMMHFGKQKGDKVSLLVLLSISVGLWYVTYSNSPFSITIN